MVVMMTFLIKLTHLLSFATAWGATFWFTFVGGLIALLNLPRHQFGNLESKMFPIFFRLIGVCCAASLTSFAYVHPWNSSSIAEKCQLGFLFFALVFDLTNLFILGPMTIKVMKERHSMERKLEIGDEIGWSKNVKVAKNNQKLAAMNTKFETIHRVAALAYIATLGCLAMHVWYLSSQIDL